jgi:GntR family transcriptional regulator
MTMIKIDPSSFVPIYEQIKKQVRSRIVAGFWRPGDPLPSIRDLAAEMIINPNTVARAYRELEKEGVIHTRKGKGCFVAAVSPPLAEEERLRHVDQVFSRAIEEAAGLGADRAEMQRVFDDCLKHLSLLA